MKKYLTILILILFAFNAMAQLDVQPGSFKEVPGFVILDSDKTDVNDIPYAVIKVRTQNINDKQRRELSFKGDMQTEIVLEYKDGEVWVYLTYLASYLKISHPDFSSTEFTIPFDMKPKCGYELTLVNNSNMGGVVPVKTSYNYLVIKADQENAMIYIDNAFVGTGNVSKSFKVGEKHRWRIECSLYYTENGEVTITEGEKVKVEKTMRPAFGYINVTSTPESGASVLIDGNLVGVTPYKSDRLASGEHKVKVMKEMFSPNEKTVMVTDGNTTQATIALYANFVAVTVTTDYDSDIYIDNENIGKGRWSGRLPDGEHTFEARKAAHRSSFKYVTLTLGKEENITLPNPEPIYGTLDINSDPMEANIFIDGVRRGETPAIISDIIIGTHELKLEKAGCATVTKTITINENNLLAINEKLQTNKSDNNSDKNFADMAKGFDYVDLGLQSGTLWATCNVGANFPEQYGNYYAWGETNTKDTYNSVNYKYSNSKILKYNTNSIYGDVDYLNVLELSDDAAQKVRGGNWRLPTFDELKELKESCRWEMTIMGGNAGYKVTGSNGNSIFLPAAGYQGGRGTGTVGFEGYYWSNTLCDDNPAGAGCLHFNSDNVEMNFYRRYCGTSVRPVLSKNKTVFVGHSGNANKTNLLPNGHEYVDLGLPSHTLWASCNVGAVSPEDDGDFYAWGDTVTKEKYNWDTYDYYRNNNMLKYNTKQSCGSVDNKKILDLSDDAANANWGGSWRMPTKTEMEELKSECTWTWTNMNGKNGYKITGKNGRSIFIPAAGYRGNGGSNTGGYYWSSSLDSDYPNASNTMNFDAGFVSVNRSYRCFGLSIRPVCSTKK